MRKRSSENSLVKQKKKKIGPLKVQENPIKLQHPLRLWKIHEHTIIKFNI